MIAESKFDKDLELYVRIFQYFKNAFNKCGYRVIETEEVTELVLLKKGTYYLIDGERFSNGVKDYYLNQDNGNLELMKLLANIIIEATRTKLNEEQWKSKIDIEKNQDELIRNKIAR